MGPSALPDLFRSWLDGFQPEHHEHQAGLGRSSYSAVGALVAGQNAIRRGSVAVDLPNIGAGAVGSVDVAIADAKTTDFAAVQPAAGIDDGLVPISAHVSADGTLTVKVLNTTGGGIDAASANWDYLLVGNDALAAS